MELSFAPLEGITYSLYRTTHAQFFGGADLYYAPFISPDSEGRIKPSAIRELLPENNEGIKLVPQLLCSRPEVFINAARELRSMGFEEINLNAGCPSGTVVSKFKGSGMLRDIEQFDNFLNEVFSVLDGEISVKTRLGMTDREEFQALMEIYRKYPLSKLIVHARTRAGMYKSRTDAQIIKTCASDLPYKLIYNGDVFSKTAEERVCTMLSPDGLMLGRGALANPALFRELRGGEALRAGELKAFHDALVEVYLASGLAPNYTIARMKELWFYMLYMFPTCGRLGKEILKSRTLPDYKAAVSNLFASGSFDASFGFSQPII